MSRARPVPAGATTMVQRRCAQRLFLLRPSDEMNEAFLYILARAVTTTGVEVHAVCAMTNHYHVTCTDKHARLPDFKRNMNSLLGRFTNHIYDRGEAVFAPGPYSRVDAMDRQALVERMVYTMANPVAAGLVERGEDWPGVITHPEDVGRLEIVAKKPKRFFSKRMPDEIRFRITTPASILAERDPIDDERSEEEANEARAREFREELRRRVDERESEHRRQIREEGRRFLGRKGVLAQDPFKCPWTQERKGAINPRVACHDKWRRMEILLALEGWLAHYDDAMERYRRGEHDAVFPAGTFKMRVQFGVRCASPPT